MEHMQNVWKRNLCQGDKSAFSPLAKEHNRILCFHSMQDFFARHYDIV